jgi:catechol 2,3-dioxygenase-like lactoylglutathione lyase family enzyme
MHFPGGNNRGMEKTQSITSTGFDHITLVCADLAATRRFYVDLIGMTEVPRPAFKFPGIWFELAGMQIHATEANEESGRAGWGDLGVKIVARGHHFAFRVANVAEAVRIAVSQGVRVASPEQIRPDGYVQAYLYDPDGHLVEVVSEP